MADRPVRIINSRAPIRICDNGGWTDTWFARHGKIFNIAVSPYVEVQLRAFPRDSDRPPVVIQAENFGDIYAPELVPGTWGRHPLLEAAIIRAGVPADCCIELHIFSQAPAGASTGTSAAVVVAIIGVLDALHGGQKTPHEIASLAHSVETDLLGQQSGIQDQLCAAYGGISFIDMFNYPSASRHEVKPAPPVWRELERRLALVYLGEPHNSSQIHDMVIQELEAVGPGARQLAPLRAAAEASRDAVASGDLNGLGQAMIRNSEAQGKLHAGLIGPDALKVIEIARTFGALGWKVNGAGGNGGSVTLLCSSRPDQKRALLAEIEAERSWYQNIPISLSATGLQVWELPPVSF